MNLTEEEFRERVISIGAWYSELDYDFHIKGFKQLSDECNDDKEVARLCYEFDKYCTLELMFLAIIGNRETEKYLWLQLKQLKNTKYEDELLQCAGALTALDIDEGFEELEKIIRNSQGSPDYSDVYDILEFIDNPRANKMKQDMLNGFYGEKAKKYAKYYTDNPRYGD